MRLPVRLKAMLALKTDHFHSFSSGWVAQPLKHSGHKGDPQQNDDDGMKMDNKKKQQNKKNQKENSRQNSQERIVALEISFRGADIIRTADRTS